MRASLTPFPRLALTAALLLAGVQGCGPTGGDDDSTPADDDGSPDDDTTPPDDDTAPVDDDGSPDDDSTPADDDTAPPDDDTLPPDDDTATLDGDGDGYGPDDCDDLDPEVYPGAPETCDGADQDCDGDIDEEAVDAPTWYFDGDGDGHGDPLAPSPPSCAAPLQHVGDAGDCDDADPALHPGVVEVCDGVDQDCNGIEDCPLVGDVSLDLADAFFIPVNVGGISAGGDVDGDGYGDLLIGQTNFGYTGAADLVYGPFSGRYDIGDGSDTDARFTGLDYMDEDVGEAVSIAGDLNGDGYHDLVIGSPGTYDGIGVVYVKYGPVHGDLGYDWDAMIITEDGDDRDKCGGGVDVAGDVNGDGNDDIIVASPGVGRTYLLLGPLVSEVSLLDAHAVFRSLVVGEVGPGSTVAGPGDLTGDGVGDVLAAAGGEFVYVFDGAGSGTHGLADASTVFYLDEERIGDLGHAVSGAGDVNGDGAADLLVSDPYCCLDLNYKGAAFLFFGPVSGSLSVGSADATFYGTEFYAMAGSSAGGAGDVDGDGFDDIVVGASRFPDLPARPGRAYLVYGPTDPGPSNLPTTGGATFLPGSLPPSYIGESVHGAGDINADGLGDFIIADLDYAYLFYGRPR